jgi:hypothetical protein
MCASAPADRPERLGRASRGFGVLKAISIIRQGGEDLAVLPAALAGARRDQLLESGSLSIAGTAKFFEPLEGDSIDIVAGYQPAFVYEPRDIFESEAVSESLLDKAKALEMFDLKTKIVGACASSFGRWKYSGPADFDGRPATPPPAAARSAQ